MDSVKRKFVSENIESGDQDNSNSHNCPYESNFDESCCPDFCSQCEMVINKTEVQPQRGSKKETKSRPDKEILNRDDFFMALVCHRAEVFCKNEEDCKIAFCLAIDEDFVALKTCSSKENCGEMLSLYLQSYPKQKYTLYINFLPDDDLQEIITVNDLKKVVYMPEYNHCLTEDIYVRFQPQVFSRIRILPHSSKKLSKAPNIKVPEIQDKNSNEKINNDRERYYICVSYLIGMRSKDPSKQVGACIVDGNQNIIGMGFCKNDTTEPFDYARVDENNEELKCEKIKYAEEDAISNAESYDNCVKGCSIYTTILPGDRKSGESGSVSLICEKGIDKVVYTPTGRIIAKRDYANNSERKFLEYARKNKKIILRPYKEHLRKKNSFPQDVDFFANVKRRMKNLKNN